MSRDDPYRDALEAAHQRIEALEQELADRRGPRQVPAELKPHLLPGETLRWWARPGARRRVLRPRVLALAGAWSFFLLFVFAAMLRGLPPPAVALAGNLLLVIGLVGGTRVLGGYRAARRSLYAITDRRLLLLEPDDADDDLRLRSLALEQVRPRELRLHGGGWGTLELSQPGRAEPLRLSWIPEAAVPYSLLQVRALEQ